jgi:hypothetical protein
MTRTPTRECLPAQKPDTAGNNIPILPVGRNRPAAFCAEAPMINWFTKLPGFQRTPAGRERTVLRLLPRVLLLGTLALGLPSLFARLYALLTPELASATLILTVDIYSISLVFLHWTLLMMVGIAAFIVMVMKGPAYVADAYPLNESDEPDDGDGRTR